MRNCKLPSLPLSCTGDKCYWLDDVNWSIFILFWTHQISICNYIHMTSSLYKHICKGYGQTLNLGWARKEHFLILLFSPIFPHFLPQFGLPGGGGWCLPGKALAMPLHVWKSYKIMYSSMAVAVAQWGMGGGAFVAKIFSCPQNYFKCVKLSLNLIISATTTTTKANFCKLCAHFLHFCPSSKFCLSPPFASSPPPKWSWCCHCSMALLAPLSTLKKL